MLVFGIFDQVLKKQNSVFVNLVRKTSFDLDFQTIISLPLETLLESIRREPLPEVLHRHRLRDFEIRADLCHVSIFFKKKIQSYD